MIWEFATSSRIVFGPGAVKHLGGIVNGLGSRPALVTGRNTERASQAVGSVGLTISIAGEPTVDGIRDAVDSVRREGCDVVVGFGGGSAIDAAKAIAALAPNTGDVLDYIEVIGRAQPLDRPPLPFIAVPTTAGTGSEVTRNAVLGSKQHRVKASLRSPSMLARAAVVDPELTLELPPAITAATGLDALTQLIEPYVCRRANPLTDSFCAEGIPLVARSLARACTQGGDLSARSDMSYAALLGGLALANAGLGVVHGFAAPIGGMFDAPHGAVCAALLPHGMEANIRALRRSSDTDALRRYGAVARLLTGSPELEAGVNWVADLCRTLRIPPLGAYGITAADVPQLVEKASAASSMKANPVVLTTQELSAVLTAAL